MVGKWSSCRIMKKFSVVQSINPVCKPFWKHFKCLRSKSHETFKTKANFLGQILSKHHKATQNVFSLPS